MITFNPATKIIQLDTTSASEKDIWTAMINWSVESDNLKYGIGMTQLGGVAPVALYIFLELGWKVRPVEADGITTITGNLLVQGGGSPIVATVGNYQTLVNMETPVQAVAIQVEGSPVVTGDITDIPSAVWSEPTRTLTDGGSGGTTPQEIWEYENRELTSSGSLTTEEHDAIINTNTLSEKIIKYVKLIFLTK